MFDDELTPAQQRVLDYIVGFSERHSGRFPRGSQIANEFGFTSSSSAYEHLLVLERKGYVTAPKEGGWRRYALTDKAITGRRRGLPLAGSIPAGPTWYAEDAEVEWLSHVADLFPDTKPGDYLLTVDGDSMVGAGLYSGMLALMRPNVAPKPGAICAVWVAGDGGTLKRVYADGEFVRLVPENPNYKERRVGAEDASIQGVLLSAISVTEFD